MIIESTYRIDHDQIVGVSYSDDFVEQQIEDGWLVPDNRLQAIADAPKCEHDKIDRHKWARSGYSTPVWCEGAPELRAAISALTKEEHD